MLSRQEKQLIDELICEKLAILEIPGAVEHSAVTEQINRLRHLQTKFNKIGELIMAEDIRHALNATCETSARHRRWLVYETDIYRLADTLNARQIHLAMA